MQDDAINAKAPGAQNTGGWSVDYPSLLIKYRDHLDRMTYDKLLAETAVNELVQRNQALIERLEEVTAEKVRQKAEFDEELEKVRAELNATLISREE